MEYSLFPHQNAIFKIADYYAKTKEDFVLLDSSLTTPEHHYLILALAPHLTISQINNLCYVNKELQNTDFTTTINDYLEKNQIANPLNLPFIDGLIGYYSYEYGVKNLAIDLCNPPLYPLPDASLAAYDILLIQDLATNITTLITHGHSNNHQEIYHRLAEICTSNSKNNLNLSPNSNLSNYQTLYTPAEYQNLVKKLIQHMVDGDIYVANLTQPFILNPLTNPWNYYLRLRNLTPAPLSAYFHNKIYKIMCTSMERLLKVQDGHLSTRPIKGTRKRGSTPKEDQLLYKELLTSHKDRSELMMITDLERNDFNRCCIPGTVKTNPDFTIEKYATVFQLVADIQGKLRPDLKIPEILDLILPGGSITGAPKHRAITLLQTYEKVQRQLYTGTIGYISCHNTAEWNIVIRTAMQTNDKLYLQAGGGITAESNPLFEYQETLQKIYGMLKALPIIK